METDQIDQLLERYLTLLDEYTQLRELLSKTQAGMYQNIARANFSAERGVRYGPDYYDERMQALRSLKISANDKGVPRYELVKPAKAVTQPVSHEDAGDEGAPDDAGEISSPEKPTADEKANRAKKSNDPLRWFGILAPLPLRQAQTLSVQAIQDVIPRLVSVDAEMMHLEIEVRRARKKRAKVQASMKRLDAEQAQEAEPGSPAPRAEVKST
ncbi:Coiled-coil domain-containing protein 115 [Colletotrichum trifolii]|uniref:Vacuolar ATPase assembly protein VMA22 n=1 Tax=Colletotrichum trifolii TaxID=5466 RepID=A0A4R8RXQ2_COLTR|nr:Coiled-coil domain-containing protein 115 [Colletotrichum trifolii]